MTKEELINCGLAPGAAMELMPEINKLKGTITIFATVNIITTISTIDSAINS